MDLNKEVSESDHGADDLVTTFIGITSANADEARFFLESHNFDIDAAVSTFLESTSGADLVLPSPANVNTNAASLSSESPVLRSPLADLTPVSPVESPLSSPSYTDRSRSRSSSPSFEVRPKKYNLRSRGHTVGSSNANNGDSVSDSRARNSARIAAARTLADLKRTADEGSDNDSDGSPDFNPDKDSSVHISGDYTADTILNRARLLGAKEVPNHPLTASSRSRRFTGTARLLSGETVSSSSQQQPETILHTITFWRNGFTVDDGPLRRLDDPANANFLECIKDSVCPDELQPADGKTPVDISLLRKDENCPKRRKQEAPFQGSGRTLGSSSEPVETTSKSSDVCPKLNTAPPPAMGLVVDDSHPSTSIQLRLSDGTRMVSRFNYHHTIRDIRSFIDASRPGVVTTYALQTVGFPPKQLTDPDETIEQAGLANSVVIQRL